MAKEKTYSATIAEIRKEVNESTIPEMIKALYQLAGGVEILSNQCMSRIQAVFAKHGIYPKENGLLKGINDYCKFTQLATSQFFAKIEPQIQGSTFNLGEPEDGAFYYDLFNHNSSELIRFCLLYLDRTTNDPKAYAKVYKTLRQLPSKELFNDEDFTRFKK